jgi:hypothetical protein
MPWKASDASGHTKQANTARKPQVWAEIANAELAKHGDEGRAIRAANAAVRRIG